MPISSTPYTAVYGPLSIGATCSLWLDGADATTIGFSSGSNVNLWKDKSSNGFNATNTSIYPTYSGSNLVFTSSQQLRLSPFIPAATKNITIAAIWTCTSASTGGAFQSIIEQNAATGGAYWRYMIQGYGFLGRNEYMYGLNEFGANPTPGTSFPTFVVGTPNLSVITQSSTDGTNFTINNYSYGSLYGTQTYGTAVGAGIQGTIGLNTNGEGFTGVISEIIIFTSASSVLSIQQRQAIEGYLAQKWGLTSQLPPGHPGLTQTLYNSRVYAPQVALQTAAYYQNFRPTQTTGVMNGASCVMWLDGVDPAGTGVAPSTGSSITTWVDKSGQGYNATGASASKATYVTGGGLLFVGSSLTQATNGNYHAGQYYTTSYTAAPTAETCFIVFKMNTATNQFFITSHQNGGRNVATYWSSDVNYNLGTGVTGVSWGAITPGTFTSGQTILGVAQTTGSPTYIATNGTFPLTGPTSAGGYTGGTTTDIGGVGAAGTYCFADGVIYEIIFYSTILSTTQRQLVESYLAQKWNMQGSLPSNHPNNTAPAGMPSWETSVTRGLANASYANTAYYNVSPQAWNYNWQPYLNSMAAANLSATPSFSSSSVTGSGFGYYGGVLAPNGKIYCIHLSTSSIGVIDPDLNSITSFGTTTSSYAGGVLAPNGKIYCIPFNATSICVIDTSTNTTTAFGSVTGTGAGSLAYDGGVLAPNGNIYAIPRNATSVGVIDPVANTFTTFGTTPGTNAYNGGVLAPNGKIYCIPFSATSVGVIDPVANTFSSVSVSGTAPGGGAYSGGVLGPNGKIYCISHNSGNIGIIDPVANTFTTFGSAPGGQAYIGAILAPNGNIYFIPYGTYSVCVISFTGLKQLPSSNYSLSAYTNKY